MNGREFYHAAAYLRLSRDDRDADGHKAVSDSIRSQREMICAYIDGQEDMELYDMYIDDGWTGMNFAGVR